MAGGPGAEIGRAIRSLFDEGTLAGQSDAQFLERFVDRRDDRAFAALVDRHGPMVRGTCRAVLGDDHEVDDAFQATFLVLAQKAGSIRSGVALGAWLARVAARIARRAARDAARRRALMRSEA